MRITSKGQVTIPQEIRSRFGLLPNTEIEFVVEKTRVYLRKMKAKSIRGSGLIDRMKGCASVRMSTDEIMDLTRGE